MLPGGLSNGKTLLLLMTRSLGRMQPQPHGTMDNGIGVDNLITIRFSPSMGGR